MRDISELDKPEPDGCIGIGFAILIGALIVIMIVVNYVSAKHG